MQASELRNIADNNETRDTDTSNRMIKFTLTDGNLVVFGLEYQRIQAVSVLSPAGTKVLTL